MTPAERAANADASEDVARGHPSFIKERRARIFEDGHATEDGIKLIEKESKDIVAEAVNFAKTSPLPDSSELYTDVYA